MEEILIKRLHDYVTENNPDLLLQLEEQGGVTTYLSGAIKRVEGVLKRPAAGHDYIFEEVCLNLLTLDLRPSKFIYIRNILEEEFEKNYEQLLTSGTLAFEVINMIHYCRHVFETIGFTEANEDSRRLRYALT